MTPKSRKFQLLPRRDFVALSAGLSAGLMSAGRAEAADKKPDSGFATQLKKALIVGAAPGYDLLKKLHDAGFDGVEVRSTSMAKAEKSREAASLAGMKIHSVLRGWAQFNSPNRDAVDKSISVTLEALKAAHAYGADAVLLVPCRIGGMRTPRPWEFLIDFNDKDGHITRLTTGDQSPFTDYIKAHDHATDASREAIKRLIPMAEKLKVVIALENVWNNLWVQPDLFRNFVASFQSPWVKAYFDVANHVKYSRPEKWILTLSDLLVKLHIKEFKLNPDDPRGEGSWQNIREGSVRWPVVRQAIERVGYNGFCTIEGGNLPPAEHCKRLDLIIAGK